MLGILFKACLDVMRLGGHLLFPDAEATKHSQKLSKAGCM